MSEYNELLTDLLENEAHGDATRRELAEMYDELEARLSSFGVSSRQVQRVARRRSRSGSGPSRVSITPAR